MVNSKAGVFVVPLEIDPEQLAAFQGALSFLADICVTYGIDNSGTIRNDHPQNRLYGEALGYVTFIAARIGEAVLTH